MKNRVGTVERATKETQIRIELNLDGRGTAEINTGVPFFDHMLTLFAVHGFFDLSIAATGDLEIDAHHTVEDLGIVLGDALQDALGDRTGIYRYGHAVTPMDEALATVSLDLSNRPYLVCHVPDRFTQGGSSLTCLAKEFFRAFSNHGGMNLHINLMYGENEHHVLEAMFKSLGRALSEAVAFNDRISGVRSSKGSL